MTFLQPNDGRGYFFFMRKMEHRCEVFEVYKRTSSLWMVLKLSQLAFWIVIMHYDAPCDAESR